MRTGAAALIILLAVLASGCTQAPAPHTTVPASSAPPEATDQPSTGHIHAGFRVFVQEADGSYTEMPFSDPVFDLQNTKFVRCHLHVGETHPHLMHIEGDLGITLRECFEQWDVAMLPHRIHFHDAAHDGRTVADNDTHEWQLWVDGCPDGPDNWAQEPFFYDYQPVQHDRFLLVFASRDAGGAELAPLMAETPTDQEMESTARDSC